jgi:hypothetical protein
MEPPTPYRLELQCTCWNECIRPDWAISRRLGLVTRVVPDGDLFATAFATAQKLAAKQSGALLTSRHLRESSTSLPAQNAFASAAPEHNADVFVFSGFVKYIRQLRVHAAGHGVLLLVTIKCDPQDAACTLGDNVAHCCSTM